MTGGSLILGEGGLAAGTAVGDQGRDHEVAFDNCSEVLMGNGTCWAIKIACLQEEAL